MNIFGVKDMYARIDKAWDNVAVGKGSCSGILGLGANPSGAMHWGAGL